MDLNRNHGYRWGGVANPAPPAMRPTAAGRLFRAGDPGVRDFVLAHPDITATITFHTYAELILYPYGYTYDDLPPDMTPVDLMVFRKLAGDMAATNGYVAEQASDLYTTRATRWIGSTAHAGSSASPSRCTQKAPQASIRRAVH